MSDYMMLPYIILFALFAIGGALLGPILDRLFYYKTYTKIKEKCRLLVQELNLEADIIEHKKFIDWIRGFSISVNIIYENYLIALFWRQIYKNTDGIFSCRIELQSSKEITFHLSKKILNNVLKRSRFSGKKEIIFEDSYFKDNFLLKTDMVDEVTLVFDDKIQQKTRKMFAIEVAATLELKRIKKKHRGNKILDSKDQYYLVYTNANYSISNKRDRTFMVETIHSMLEIAKRVDEL